MKGIKIAVLTLPLPFLLGLAAPAATQELPPDVQLDRLMVQADRQIAGEQFGAALRTLDRILELQEQHDLELPDPFWMKRAEVGVGAGNHLEAMAAATRYLELAGREGEHYEAALELLDEAIARGCTPERMTETLESVRACLAAGADPNGIGEDGRSTLDWAAERADPGITAALIAGGADPAAAAARRTLLQPVYFDCVLNTLGEPSDACVVITPATEAALRARAEILRANPGVMLRMEGHADERHTTEMGIALGNDRAEAVIQVLVRLGLSADRFTPISYGELMPAVEGSNEEAWALNRRVEFVITAGGESLVGAVAAAAAPQAAGEAAMEPGAVFRDCAACPEMVVVPPGSFMMGLPGAEEGRFERERPRHRVTIDYPFAVGVYEVTFAEWDACLAAGGCGGYRPEDEGWGRGSRPVIHVSWEDAREYVRWLSRETGEEYRLLTEAEWEYVARAGTATARYWGERETGQCRYANGYDRTGQAELIFTWDPASCSDGYVHTAPVGLFEPNGFGLYDVLGNVWEWTQDCWNESYWGAPADGSAWSSGDCSLRVVRGGSWGNAPRDLRSAFRGRDSAGDRDNRYLGFRVARTMN